ncbi:MAG: hypothetical protein M3N19_12645, partial [Candidatus Eremiobacteraeota bacterium]|nr:hypothetical protein [Candidatus Eremiobacteraeota bacterium]
SWTIAVSTTTNPANSTGAPTNELLTSIDSANSTTGSGMVVDQTAMAVVPTAGTLQLAHGPTGITPRRLPFDLIESFRLAIGTTDPLTPVTSPITYTFIAN